jgi:hypothetical protein
VSDVYVVMGQTGEYSDRTEWVVVAYSNEADAQKHVENATRRAKELEVTKPRNWEALEAHLASNEFDPAMQLDYTGTRYYYMAVELRS